MLFDFFSNLIKKIKLKNVISFNIKAHLEKRVAHGTSGQNPKVNLPMPFSNSGKSIDSFRKCIEKHSECAPGSGYEPCCPGLYCFVDEGDEWGLGRCIKKF